MSPDPVTLRDLLGFEPANIDDPLRGEYFTLFEAWYKLLHGGREAPFLYGSDGRLWRLLPREARICAMAYIQHGFFDAMALWDYRRELLAMCVARDLDDDSFVIELAALNRPFLHHMEHGGDGAKHVAHVHQLVVDVRGHKYCAGCNAAAVALVQADNGAEIATMLQEMPDGQRQQALDRLGFGAHVKEFQIASANWMEIKAGGFRIASQLICE
jgi:hypothetical protein